LHITPLFRKMSAHTLGFVHAHHRERYICPICNMGSGHEKRAYVRKSANNGTGPTATGSFFTGSSGNPRDYTGEFQMASAFDRHIIERHEKIFESMTSSEYICLLCPCDSIAHSTLQCTARFSTTSGKQGFLDHLRTFHAGDPDSLALWQHLCAPTTTASYHPALRKVAELLLKFPH
jgi:hypothetical protein